MSEQPSTHFLRLFPLESVVLFPGMELPLVVFEPRYQQLTQECLEAKEPFGVLLLRSGREVGGGETKPYEVGTTAEIHKVEQLEDGRLRVMVIGKDRFRVRTFQHDRPYLAAEVEYFPHDAGDEVPADVLAQIKEACAHYVQGLLALRGGYLREITLPDDPEDLSYLVALFLEQQYEVQQELLEIETTTERLEDETKLLVAAYEDVKDQMERRWWMPTPRRN